MTAIYAGSFDPFTNGHLDIVREATRIFDFVIIVCAVNSKKAPRFNRDEMCYAITECLRRHEIFNAKVMVSDQLISEIATKHDAEYLVRGLRNTMDFMYEEEIAKFNHRINPELRTIYIRAVDETLSSSAVKELLAYGRDISELVPKEVLAVIIHELVTPNVPLTLNELREMIGEPVWVKCLEPGMDHLSCWGIRNSDCVDGYHTNYCDMDYGKSWLAYRHKPSE